MKFNISQSKLYDQIMSACASFFGLGDDATETDIHAKLDGSLPFDQQIENAKNEAIADLKAQFEALKETSEAQAARISALETSVSDAIRASATKDQRITEMQTEAATAAQTLESLKAQHQKEVENLAGQVATLKASSQQTIHPSGGATHPAAAISAGVKGNTVIARSSELDKLLRPNK